MTLNQGFIPAKWAALTPRALAVHDVPHERRVSWSQLDERVRRLANGLLGLGARPGDRVAVLARNRLEYVELYFACGRAGLVLQPLNWRLTGDELVRLVHDGSPRVVVADAEWAARVRRLQQVCDVARWLEFGADYEQLLAASSDAEPDGSEHVGGDDPFFILYTGGTTGRAKGALHTHRSAEAGGVNQTVAERIVPGDVYLMTGQMFHIPIVLAMNYLRHGCPLVLVNFEAEQALRIIEQERVSAFLGITTMLNWMMAVPGFAAHDLSSLRNIQYGGGPMPSSIVRAALDAFPCSLIQGYGQTEGPGMAFLSQEDHVAAVAGRHPHRLRSCGREGFGARLRVVDPGGREVPLDGRSPGQIVVRSEANMARYWNRPELTARTVRDGWMWTGDIATWDEQRYVYIVDRAKDMIVSGGENIYSVQVEEAVAAHPAVLECAVIGVPDDEWGENVKAVVVLKPDAAATEADIITTAKRHLPSYQKPKSVDFVASLPKAPTGKVIKRELRAPYWADQERSI
ncbi:long-chain fatty acid--CoA ligase [Saccharopolyspora gloriosae]|uniref:Acyl-CoA synthetase (AMP-forming)/AMP-acid ligase II n=1 Tax=Saccharopolyspora gloriosae TaxID=455344 RepID=A0A840NKD2_9PSEU|nr:AMP-binding protein [Saccharopolyspora gloriosae]MBB5069739.1 acyl-CoA synthetase (AMP-forming)/AMP-acid ligase II [Saccharopolyspora gloriosae]